MCSSRRLLLVYAPTGFMIIVWAVVIIAALLLIGLVIVLSIVISRARKRRRMLGIWCRKCDYSLRGLSEGLLRTNCPECGADLSKPYAIRRFEE
jgi:hypothetical protein